MDGLILYAMADGSFATWDSSKINSPFMVLSKDEIWKGSDTRIEGLVRDWVQWQMKEDSFPFSVFKEILRRISPPDMGPLEPGSPMRLLDSKWGSREIPTIRYPYGEVPITNSSSGISRMITLAYLMVWMWNEHLINCELRQLKPASRMIMIIDELEAHLHPKWQRAILPALLEVPQNLNKNLQVQFLITTHSPLVLASAETSFSCEQDKLFHLDLDRNSGNAILSEETFIKHGEVNNWLTSDIFELEQARSVESEEAIKEAQSLQSANNPSQADVKAVHEKLLHTLSETDPYWSRWLYFAESHGVEI